MEGRALYANFRLVAGAGIRPWPWVALLMLAVAALDMLTVALVAPLLAALLGSDALAGALPAGLGLLLREVDTPVIAGVVVMAFIAKAVLTLRMQYSIANFSESIRGDLMVRLLSAYQDKPYAWHLAGHSSDRVNRVGWYAATFANGVVAAGARLAADAVMAVGLVLLILSISWVAFLVVLLALAGVIGLAHAGIRRHTTVLARRNAALGSEVIRTVTHSLTGLREVRLIGCENHFLGEMARTVETQRQILTRLAVWHAAPRQIVEAVVVALLMAGLLLALASGVPGEELVAAMALIGAAAIRLVPASSSLLANLNTLRTNSFTIDALAADLREAPEARRTPVRPDPPGAPAAPWRFERLEFRAVRFSYGPERPPVLEDFDCEIDAGEIVGLAGPSGVGKSTLADLMLGLLSPQSGSITVNGAEIEAVRSRWQARVGYIPQVPFLLDDTLRRNVALGVPDAAIDEQRVRDVVEAAQLGELLDPQAAGLDVRLGESGVRLSGGQRQRVSIARALYHDREFLVLDEATSALDEATEREVVGTLLRLRGSKTVVIISHRPSTLSACSRVIRLESVGSTQSVAASAAPRKE